METESIAIYCWTCLILDSLGMKEDKRRLMTDAELVCTLIVASRFFYGNIDKARCFLNEHGYIPNMLSSSRFNRRMHLIAFLSPAATTSASFILESSMGRSIEDTQPARKGISMDLRLMCL